KLSLKRRNLYPQRDMARSRRVTTNSADVAGQVLGCHRRNIQVVIVRWSRTKCLAIYKPNINGQHAIGVDELHACITLIEGFLHCQRGIPNCEPERRIELPGGI